MRLGLVSFVQGEMVFIKQEGEVVFLPLILSFLVGEVALLFPVSLVFLVFKAS